MIIETNDWQIHTGRDLENDNVIIRVTGPDGYEFKKAFQLVDVAVRGESSVKGEALGLAMTDYTVRAKGVEKLLSDTKEPE